MLITWESSGELIQGTNAQMYQDDEGVVHLLYLPFAGGQIHESTATVSLGIWDKLEFSAPTPVAPDEGITNLTITHVTDNNIWLLWQTDKAHRFAIDPDDGEILDPTTPYRLFYAVDTEKLYMNISETWQFIGSPNVKTLEGFEDHIEDFQALGSSVAQQGADVIAVNEAVISQTAKIVVMDELITTQGTTIETQKQLNESQEIIIESQKQLNESQETTIASLLAAIQSQGDRIKAIEDAGGITPPDPEPEPEPDPRDDFAIMSRYSSFAGNATQAEADNFIDVVHNLGKVFKIVSLGASFMYIIATTGSYINIDTGTNSVTSDGDMFTCDGGTSLNRPRGASINWAGQPGIIVHETYTRV